MNKARVPLKRNCDPTTILQVNGQRFIGYLNSNYNRFTFLFTCQESRTLNNSK